MTKKNHRVHWTWGAVVVAGSLGLIWSLCPVTDASARMARVPLRMPQVRGVELELTHQEVTSFGGAASMKRFYVVGGQPFHLLVLDGTMDRHAIHDPLYCIRGAGWTIENEQEIALRSGTANTVTLGRNGETVHAVYWFSNGKTKHASIATYWAQTTLRRASLGLSGPEPVLIILQSKDYVRPNWKRILRDFRPLAQL